jgi:hypothetical protein
MRLSTILATLVVLTTGAVHGWHLPHVRALVRRAATAAVAVAVGCHPQWVAPAAADAAVSVKRYTNARYHTAVDIPADFEDRSATLATNGGYSDRPPVVAFVDPAHTDTSVSLVFTAIPADFTRLSSFGNKDTIRALILPKPVDGLQINQLNEAIKGEMYTTEYVISYNGVDGETLPTRHVISAFALRPAETVVGLTVQALEKDYPAVQAKLAAVLPSFTVETN